MLQHVPRVAARTGLRRAIVIVGSLALVAGLTGPALAADDSATQEFDTVAPDREIVSGLRDMSSAEITAGDVTGTSLGGSALGEFLDGEFQDVVNISSVRVYTFGGDTWAIPADQPFTAVTGLNAAGERVYVLNPVVKPAEIALQAGYAVPPRSAFSYNNSNAWAETVGTWRRWIFWTLTKANNWRPCSTCVAHDYFRMYGKMRAGSVQGSAPDEGYKQAWIEFDHTGGNNLAPFEPDQPANSYAGVANQIVTVGFGASFGINIGVPPLTGSGTVDASYGGSMTQSTENWHPVIRTEDYSGGVQWCRYQSAEFTGTKTISTRVSVRTSATGSPGGWFVLRGQRDTTSRCPSRI